MRALLLALLLAAPVVGAQETPARDPEPVVVRVHTDLSNATGAAWWYRVVVRQAFAWWEENDAWRLGQEVRFEEAPPEDAQVRAWLRDSSRVGPTCDESPTALGCARYLGPGRVDVEVKMRRDGDDAYYSYSVVRDVMKHEIGHALGLPHSDDPRDIMFHALDTTAYGDAQPVEHPLRVVGVVLALVVGGALALLLLLRAAWRRDADDDGEERLPR